MVGPCRAGRFRRRVQLGSLSLDGDEVDGVVRGDCVRVGWRANHAPSVAVGALKKKEFVGVPDTLSGWRGVRGADLPTRCSSRPVARAGLQRGRRAVPVPRPDLTGRGRSVDGDERVDDGPNPLGVSGDRDLDLADTDGDTLLSDRCD